MPFKRKLQTMLAGGLLLATATAAPAAEDLVEVYQLAERNDAQLRAAEQARLAALEARPLARSRLLPQVGGNASASRNHLNDRTGLDNDATYNDFQLGLSLTHPLYYRDREIALEQAGKQVRQAEVDYAAAKQDLVLRVAEAYFNVLEAQAETRFAEANRRAIERQLEQTRKRFEVGLTAITDVHEAKARFDQAQAGVITATNQLDNALEALATITNQEHDALADLDTGVPLETPDPERIGEWVERALENNFQVRSQRLAVAIARQEVEKQRSGHYPTVDLEANYGYQDTRQFGMDREATSASVGVAVNVPFYTGGAIASNTRQSVYDFQRSQENLEGRLRETRRQTRDAYRGVMSSISEVRALEQALTSAETALEATEAGFEVGTRTIVDVLDAQRAQLEARRDLAVARYNYLLNGLRLKKAAGSLAKEDLMGVNQLLD